MNAVYAYLYLAMALVIITISVVVVITSITHLAMKSSKTLAMYW